MDGGPPAAVAAPCRPSAVVGVADRFEQLPRRMQDVRGRQQPGCQPSPAAPMRSADAANAKHVLGPLSLYSMLVPSGRCRSALVSGPPLFLDPSRTLELVRVGS